jgi:beta-lactamase regulating signal transducer with metallopeptidase domain
MTPFILALLTKLTLMLGFGLLVTAIFRSASPSHRHLIIFATIASCVVLPFAMWMSPQWNVAVLPRFSSAAPFSPNDQSSGWNFEHGPSSPFPDSRALNRITNTPPGARYSMLTPRVIDAGNAQSLSGARRVLATLPLLPLVWLVGFIAVIGWLAIGRFRLRRIAATSWPLDQSDWTNILDDERRDAGVEKYILLCSSSVASTPLTWGSRAPVILLPEDALDWPEAHRRIVLRHELAHIARGDSLSQLVAGFVCALYWFHPLAWMAERRLRAECERACDDNVVSLGTPAAEYAAHLLEVARSARALGAPGFLSVAMARPSQLEGRLLAVLNESRRRVSLSRAARPAATVLSALVLIPLAAFRAVPKLDEPARATASLNDGIATYASREGLASSRSNAPTQQFNSAESHSQATATSIVSTQSIAPVGVVIASAESSAAALAQAASTVDTTFQLSVPAQSAGTLILDLNTGGKVVITGWDKPQVLVRGSLGGRDWRQTNVELLVIPSEPGARLVSDYTGHSSTQSFSHVFEINVPHNFNVRISSAGGSLSITGVDGEFTGHTGGGEIDIQRANGQADLNTGGGDIRVSNSRLNGTVTTGGGVVRIEDVTGDLKGYSGSGPVSSFTSMKFKNGTIRRENGGTIIDADSIEFHAGSGSGSGSSSGSASSSGSSSSSVSESGSGSGSSSGSSSSSGSGGATITTTNTVDGSGRASSFGASGIRLSSAGGAILLRAAPNGARVTTGGGAVRIGPSGGEVYAETGAGPIDIGRASGSVEAHTGAGDVTIELEGGGPHSLNVTSGKGQVVLVLPRDLNATLELETAYTNNLGHKTRIVSDIPLKSTETASWDSSEGTPRRYVRARQTVGRGGPVIRVRTVNGDVVLQHG